MKTTELKTGKRHTMHILSRLIHWEQGSCPANENTYYHCKKIDGEVFMKYDHIGLAVPGLVEKVYDYLELKRNTFALPGHSVYVRLTEVIRVCQDRISDPELIEFLESIPYQFKGEHKPVIEYSQAQIKELVEKELAKYVSKYTPAQLSAMLNKSKAS